MAFLGEWQHARPRSLWPARVSGVDFILANTQESGFINVPGSGSHGPMYGHGFATLFLAEAYGMSQQPEFREKLSKAVNLIINTQNSEGGWRYQPRAPTPIFR